MLHTPKATVIVSIYRDIVALEVILCALEKQSCRDFSVIVSEDGESPEVAAYLARRKTELSLKHLTQPDKGFRKNRALNRAILAAPAPILIFIDGDCVPHPRFVESHLRYTSKGHVSCGRRIELGPDISAQLREKPEQLSRLTSAFSYLMLARTLHRDGIKNYELGFYMRWLQPLLQHKSIAIVGCNFSVHRTDIEAVNGFNEAYESPGLGEDTDIEWRLRKHGAILHDTRVTALQYHLYHNRGYQVSTLNRSLFSETQKADSPYCKLGLDTHCNRRDGTDN